MLFAAVGRMIVILRTANTNGWMGKDLSSPGLGPRIIAYCVSLLTTLPHRVPSPR